MIHTLWDIDDYRESEGETSTSRAGSVYGFFLQCVDVCEWCVRGNSTDCFIKSS